MPRAPGRIAVLCRVGTRLCALPVEHVEETLRPLPVERLAGAPPFVLGVSIVRGAPLPVVDAAGLLGGAPAEGAPAPGAAPPRTTAGTTRPPAARLLTLKVGERRVALAVDAVVGVRPLAAGDLGDLPPLLRAAEAVAAMGALDEELLLVLRTARAVPDSVWDAIQAGEA